MHHVEHFVVDQGAAAESVDFVVTVLGKFGRHRVLKIIGAFFGDHVDRAGKGRATEEGRLRPFDHFDAFDDVKRQRQH